MSIHVALTHITQYLYDRPIHLGPQIIRLRPAPHTRTRVLSYSLKVEPANHFINWQQDPQANYMARLVFPDKTNVLRVQVNLVAEMATINPFDFFLEPTAEHFPLIYTPELVAELAPYLVKMPLSSTATPLFIEYLTDVPLHSVATNSFLVELNQRLQRDISYLVRMEPGVQTPEETLLTRSGSCRDSAWLLVQLLRHLGLAARFVSGYLIQLKSDVQSLTGHSGVEQDFTDLHAWCEVYLPGAGWVGLDPTSGLFAGEGHIALACSHEPTSAAPISGALEECATQLEHAMQVVRVWEEPRASQPYTESQWQAIHKLGLKVDTDLTAHDVRLTQGGEPTFMAIDNRDAAEWNTDAMGPTKQVLSAELMQKLRAEYGAGGLLHCGQGKWYPGEPLPRWSLNLFWRKDGEPIWAHPELLIDLTSLPIADEAAADEPVATAQQPVTEAQAHRFLHLVAKRLGVAPEHVFPAYEDTWYHLWRERKLPSNLNPFDARLADPLERDRLCKVFTQGLDAVVGHVLPLARGPSSAGTNVASAATMPWRSSSWFLRSERCYLAPGNSALGYRLPLDSQPWARSQDLPWIHAPDPSAHFESLPAYQSPLKQPPAQPLQPPRLQTFYHSGTAASAQAVFEQTVFEQAASDQIQTPQPLESAAFITRTALCAEPRDGRLCIFMPPMPTLESYLELLAVIEITAVELAQPIVLEGYEPPRDPRLTTLRITPDPGVIEVNVQPTRSWPELVAQTMHLYACTESLGLSAEKFMLDGRHTGTGGGNHLVLGGATAADSPFLRRPDLLASLIAYWHNHPGLSYLFAGMFIGPTSQAPRVDEARNDAVYELEIALAELQRTCALHRNEPPLWAADRLLRNLLVDVAGNTHRAEFCIDKLYSPEGPAGRLGLLEMRAFEMPPHPRMGLAQQLLVRTLIAHFWKQPYRPARLRRWGTELHDRFMLPHFIWQDLGQVLEELNAAGYPLKLDWFAPHLSFRFPRLGDFAAQGVLVELHMALEPWHVMGEESASGGTSRFVDSSLERIQVKVSGLSGDAGGDVGSNVGGNASNHLSSHRLRLTCNGRAIPLQPTGCVGEWVGSVRFKAWNPPSALHPTMVAHVPLVFDLLDTWMQRSVAGCQYHVAHPGGRTYDTYPVNALEAQARRLARFVRAHHTPGAMQLPKDERNPDFPFTLDLRRAV
jgi:uncharacterized protein (DUF2126 family)/transglutaminase-like putative cysteine protease